MCLRSKVAEQLHHTGNGLQVLVSYLDSHPDPDVRESLERVIRAERAIREAVKDHDQSCCQRLHAMSACSMPQRRAIP